MRHTPARGISIVEIVIAAAVIGVSVVGLVGAVQVYLKLVYQNTRQAQAVLLLDETAEALQYLRDDSFSEHIGGTENDTAYAVVWNGTGYELGTSTITLPYDMTRTVMFSTVERDSSDKIVSSGGSVDGGTRRATITISWPYKEATSTVSSELLIHNTYDN